MERRMPLLEIGTILIAIIAWPAIIVVYFWKQISNWYLDRYEKAEPPAPPENGENVPSFSFDAPKDNE